MAPSSFQASSFIGSNQERTRSLTSNAAIPKGSRRTRILLNPGSTVTSEAGKAAPATSMNDTNAQGTIEFPVHDMTVQDVIAGSGVDMPKPTSPPWQVLFEEAYPSLQSRDGRPIEPFGSRPFTPSVGEYL